MKAGRSRSISTRWRWLLLLTVIATVVGVVVMNGAPRDKTVPPPPPTVPNSNIPLPTTPPAAAVDSAIPERGREIVDLFASRTWEPPTPPAIVTPAPPAPLPQAPPLPFRFFGRVIDPDQAASFVVARGNELITVRVGERIEPSYLVEKFDGTQLHLLYLPLNIRQTLFVGNANE